MNKYPAKKIVALVVLAIAVFAIASFSFIDSALAARPSVETRSASDIGDNSATLNGYLYTNGEDTTYWFEYGTSRTNLNQNTSERDVSDRDGRVSVFNEIRNGLISDRTYYFRIVAENDDGFSQGDILSFRTDDDGDNDDGDRPTMETLSAQVQLNGTSAILNGSVDSRGNYAQVWFRYGRSSGSLDLTTQILTMFGDADKDYSRTIHNLTPGRTYYYQAVGRNENGTDDGQIRSFVASTGGGTDGPDNFQLPAVSTNSAVVTGNNSATLRAQVNPNGNLSSVWFEYGRSTSLGGATTRDPAGSGTSFTDYSVSLNGLSAGTTYYYRAVAQNSAGTVRGQILNFRTQGTAVVPTTPNPPTTPTTPITPTNPTPTTPNGAPDCLTVSPALSSQQLSPDQDFTYSVTYRNDCGFALSAATLQVTLPLAVDFAGTNYPFLTRDGSVITYNLGVIADNFQSAVTVDGKVRSQAPSGDSLIFQSDVNFTTPAGASQNASAFLSAMVVGDADSVNGTSTLAASIGNALGGLFYSGWFWLVLFLILIALFVFWLATRRRDSEDNEEEGDGSVSHAH